VALIVVAVIALRRGYSLPARWRRGAWCCSWLWSVLDAQIVCAAVAAVITAGLVGTIGASPVGSSRGRRGRRGDRRLAAYTHWEAVGEAATVVIEAGRPGRRPGGGAEATFLIWLVPRSSSWGALLARKRRIDDGRPRSTTSGVAKKENAPGYAQNHHGGHADEAGRFRKLTWLTLWAIGRIQYWFRPVRAEHGRPLRRVVPPSRHEMMLFLANYDGGREVSWGFRDQGPRGPVGRVESRQVSRRPACWSWRRDGDRFKRWVRRQRIVAQFWYSRFPRLTTDQIRNNALIHDGLMRAETDTARAARCFGTMPRPDNSIRREWMLIFSRPADPSIHEIRAITFSDAQARTGCGPLEGNLITYGDSRTSSRPVAFVAFSAQASPSASWRRSQHDVGNDGDVSARLPPRHGCRGGSRRHRPVELKEWRWADVDRAGDRAGRERQGRRCLLVYGRNVGECRAVVDDARQDIET
jgi:hypothetical protein